MKRERFAPRGPIALEPRAFGLGYLVRDAADEAKVEEIDGAAVVRIQGPLSRTEDPCWDSYASIERRVRHALASSAPGVLLVIDSPGGIAAGSLECGRALRAMAAAANKPLVSFVSGMACSAGMALALAAHRVVSAPTSTVGSIGIIEEIYDVSARDKAEGFRFEVITSGARKADGHPHVPVSAETLSAVQASVDGLAKLFWEYVAEMRPALTAEAVRGLEASAMLAGEGLKVGLVDELGTLESAAALAAKGSLEIGSSKTPSGAGVSDMTDEEKALAALKALAGGSGAVAAKAKKALAAMTDEEPAAEEIKEEPAAEDEEPKEEEPAAEDAPEDDKKVAKARGGRTEAKASVEARLEALEQREERSKLLSTRPDLMRDKATASWLRGAALAVVRDAVKSLPKMQPGKPAAAAQASVTPTFGASQQDVQRSPERLAIAQAMGNVPVNGGLRREGNALVFGIMTPEQARQRKKELEK